MIDKNCYEWTQRILNEVFKNASLKISDKIVRVIFNSSKSGDVLKCVWVGDERRYCVDLFFNDARMVSSFDWESTKKYIDMFQSNQFNLLRKIVDDNNFEL